MYLQIFHIYLWMVRQRLLPIHILCWSTRLESIAYFSWTPDLFLSQSPSIYDLESNQKDVLYINRFPYCTKSMVLQYSIYNAYRPMIEVNSQIQKSVYSIKTKHTCSCICAKVSHNSNRQSTYTLSSLPVLFKILLPGQKDCVFFSRHLNLRTTPETGFPSRGKKKIITIKLKKTEW